MACSCRWENHGALAYLLPPAFLFLSCCAWTVLRSGPLPIGLIGAVATVSFASRAVFDGPFYVFPAMALPIRWSLRSLSSGRQEQRYFAMAILLYGAALLNPLTALLIPGWPGLNYLYVGPFQLSITATISTLVSFIVMILLLRVVGADRRDKYRLAAEFEAARSVQQLLLQPGAGSREYPVDAVYLPASEVGGDFYQRIEDGEGGFTIAVGDVSGKGLKAAMLVSMIVGVLRKDGRLSPCDILASLNESLVQGGMSGGFVTCLCAHFAPDGRVRLANAGHLAPYSGGKEVPVESGLPLGVAPGIAYAETETWLLEGEQMAFVSDGVVEAADAKGALLGFDRTREISGKPAQEIAEAAKAWGQNDDITVVTVRRSA